MPAARTVTAAAPPRVVDVGRDAGSGSGVAGEGAGDRSARDAALEVERGRGGKAPSAPGFSGRRWASRGGRQRKKTRSRQKNLRRDTRTADKLPEHLRKAQAEGVELPRPSKAGADGSAAAAQAAATAQKAKQKRDKSKTKGKAKGKGKGDANFGAGSWAVPKLAPLGADKLAAFTAKGGAAVGSKGLDAVARIEARLRAGVM